MVSNPAPELELYGFYGSFCTQKVLLALAEKGLAFRYHSVDIGPAMRNYEPWYARLNPRMVVPTLRHNTRVVCDSAAIVRYLDRELPGPKLVPRSPAQAARVQSFVDLIDALPIRELSYGRMTGALRQFRDRVLMPRRLRMLRRGRATAPELAALYDARIADVEAWVLALGDPGAREADRVRLHDSLSQLEAALIEQRPMLYLVGSDYSLADLMSTVLCARLKAMNLADLTAYPRLSEHFVRMRSRPNFPHEAIVERVAIRRILPIVAPFIVPRVALFLAVVCLVVWLCASAFAGVP